MEVIFKFSNEEIQITKQLINDQKKAEIYRERMRKNVRKIGRPNITPGKCWDRHMMCLLTSTQKSGAGSSVRKFLDLKPFPLKLSVVEKQKDKAVFVAQVLKRAEGIRRYNIIGDQANENIQWFSEKKWKTLQESLKNLSRHKGHEPERETAVWLANIFKGIGPKQSRNYLQALGLSQYEIPIDSRVRKWMHENFDLSISLGSKAISDEQHYQFVNDIIRSLCKKLSIYPCMLDAAIFSTYE